MHYISNLLQSIHIDVWFNIFKVLAIVIVGVPLAFFVSKLVKNKLAGHASEHIAVLTGNLLLYAGIFLVLITLLQQLGFSIAGLLGAAGVLGVGVGFAAQKSVSNIISGIFLIFERSFMIKDFIQAKSFNGTVESIDLMSVKLRTPDGTLVRIPNESLLAEGFTNLTYYKNQRLSLVVQALPDVDVQSVFGLLEEVVAKVEGIQKKPEPFIYLRAMSIQSADFIVQCWVASKQTTAITVQITKAIKQQAQQKNIALSIK